MVKYELEHRNKDDEASVRFQVQQGSNNHLADDVQKNSIEEGVTKNRGIQH